jgi:hypothetical protein
MQPDEETAAYEPSAEVPVEDAAEQAVIANPNDEEATAAGEPMHRGLEVSEWDATEQARTAGLDDDYR